MTLQAARKLLGLLNGYTAETVRAAFVAAVRKAHPDAGEIAGADVGRDVHALVEAKDLLLANLGGETPCPQCKGVGYVRARVGVIDCGRCGGEGTV